MPKSRVDKSRKKQLIKYKKSKKMSKAPEMKPFRQIPTWAADDKFEVTGSELESLYNFFNIFAPAFQTIQSVFARGVQEAKIKIGYQYEDGSPVSDEEMSAYTEQLNKYFEERVKFNADKEDTGAKILNINGVEATPENVG